jgi:AcrR family transcriptional regulator
MAGLRARKKEKGRWALVRTALRLFEERGFEQTTVEAIAEAADTSPRTFFRYFGSKKDVILVDSARKLALIDECLSTARPDEPILDTLQRVWAKLADVYLSDVDVTLATYRLSRSEPGLAAQLLSFQTQWSHALARAISVQLGVDASDDLRPEIIASTSQAVLRSAFNRWAEAGCPGPAREVVFAGFASIGPALRVVLEQLEPATPSRTAEPQQSDRTNSRPVQDLVANSATASARPRS